MEIVAAVSPEQFAKRLREICREKDITGSELARRMGVRQSNASAWLRGQRTPSIENAPSFAKALGVSLDELFTDPKEGEDEDTYPKYKPTSSADDSPE